MKKPKILYSFNSYHELEKHRLTAQCNPQLIRDEIWKPGADFGKRYRCRCDDHDVYGWDTLKAAKAEDKHSIQLEIVKLQNLLKDR